MMSFELCEEVVYVVEPLVTFVWEVPESNLGWFPDYSDRVLMIVFHYFETNDEAVFSD
jgi:hypothetical protein